jgi:hypothetical protein
MPTDVWILTLQQVFRLTDLPRIRKPFSDYAEGSMAPERLAKGDLNNSWQSGKEVSLEHLHQKPAEVKATRLPSRRW